MQPSKPARSTSTSLVPAFPDPIPGIIPFGSVTLCGGEARIGKSPMVISWIPRWEAGKTIMGRPTNCPTGFRYLVGDRSWSEHQKWFDRLGHPGIPHYAIADDLTFNLERLNNPLQAHQILLDSLTTLDVQPGNLLIIEPYVPLFMNGDEMRKRAVATGMHRLRRLCRSLQINIIAMVHFVKQPNDTAKQYKRCIDRMSGSGAFAGYSDNQLYLVGPDEEHPYHIFGWNPSHEPEQQFPYVRNAHGLFVPYTGLLAEGTSAANDRPTHLLELFPPAPGVITFGDLLTLVEPTLKISPATLRRDLKILQERRLISKDGWGAYCRRKLA